MNKIRPIIFALLLLLVLPAEAVYAGPMLKLSAADTTPTNGGTFKATLSIDSGSAKSIAVDAWLTFDATKLEVVSIDPASTPAFSNTMGKNINNADGKFDISFNASGDIGIADATAAKGDLAVITFKGKSTGTAEVKFSCTAGSTIDTNIFDTNAADVIDCASNVNGNYSVGAGSGTDPTATPVVRNVTAAAGELPRTGGFETTMGLMIFGLVGALAGVALRWL